MSTFRERADARRLHFKLIAARAVGRAYRDAEHDVSTLLRPARMTVADCLVLEALSRRGERGASITDIASFLGKHHTSAPVVIEAMLTSGFVAQVARPVGAVSQSFIITEAGRAALALARDLLAQSESEAGAANGSEESG